MPSLKFRTFLQYTIEKYQFSVSSAMLDTMPARMNCCCVLGVKAISGIHTLLASCRSEYIHSLMGLWVTTHTGAHTAQHSPSRWVIYIYHSHLVTS